MLHRWRWYATEEDAYLLKHEEINELSEETYFRNAIFYEILDNVIGGLSVHFNAAANITAKIIFF